LLRLRARPYPRSGFRFGLGAPFGLRFCFGFGKLACLSNLACMLLGIHAGARHVLCLALGLRVRGRFRGSYGFGCKARGRSGFGALLSFESGPSDRACFGFRACRDLGLSACFVLGCDARICHCHRAQVGLRARFGIGFRQPLGVEPA
jgi:hypothetical protein